MWIDSRCARARDGGVAAKKKSSPLTRRLEAFPRCAERNFQAERVIRVCSGLGADAT